MGDVGSCREISHEWLATLWENNRTNNRNNAPSPKTITAANNEENYKLTGADTLMLTTHVYCCCRNWTTFFHLPTIWIGRGMSWLSSTFFHPVTANSESSRNWELWHCSLDGWTLFCSFEGELRCFKSAWTRRDQQTLTLNVTFCSKFRNFYLTFG